jgi:Cdc6-like AAA superfamily ATPase
MKLTKSKLKQIIAEEVAKLQEKNDEKAMMANMARADDARRAAKAAAKAAESAEKKKNETHEALNEQELAIDGLLEEAQIEIEESLNGLSEKLTDVGLGEIAVIDVLNLLLTKLMEHVEQGFVGPPA